MLVRLDWGGIDADDDGRDQLAAAAVVLEFLLADYKALAEEKRAALRLKYAAQTAVDDNHLFGGFDAYKRVIGSSDVVLIANAAKLIRVDSPSIALAPTSTWLVLNHVS